MPPRPHPLGRPRGRLHRHRVLGVLTALGAITTAITTATITAGTVTAAAGPPAYAVRVAPDGPAVTRYVLGGTSETVVDASAAALTTLGVDGVVIAADGRGVEQPDAATRALVGTAHARGLRAELLVSNYSDALGGFDTAAAGRLLRHESRVRRVAATLAGTAVSQGWDGITVDLESLRPADGPGLVLLVRELQARMPAELTASVDLMAATSPRGYRRGGYRLGELATAADVLVVMTYDLHGPTWSGPGPIGPSSWQRRAIAALLTRVPADHVDLGVAGYGYTWPRAATGRTGRAVPVPRARRLADRPGGSGPDWRAGPGEWTATLADGTTLWWSDARSYARRLELADQLGLHGVALWRLGSADPLVLASARPITTPPTRRSPGGDDGHPWG